MKSLNDKIRVKLSKLLSKILRHQPEMIHLELDQNGWCDLDVLIGNIKKYTGERWSFLEKNHIIETMGKDEKGRFAIEGNRIRAVQGHTNQSVNLEFEEIIPQDDLFHGTSRQVVSIILKDGLVPMNRHYVHLSKDKETAVKVGRRRDGKPAILKIRSVEAHQDGIQFFISENNVYLAKHIPAKYIEVLE